MLFRWWYVLSLREALRGGATKQSGWIATSASPRRRHECITSAATPGVAGLALTRDEQKSKTHHYRFVARVVTASTPRAGIALASAFLRQRCVSTTSRPATMPGNAGVAFLFLGERGGILFRRLRAIERRLRKPLAGVRLSGRRIGFAGIGIIYRGSARPEAWPCFVGQSNATRTLGAQRKSFNRFGRFMGAGMLAGFRGGFRRGGIFHPLIDPRVGRQFAGVEAAFSPQLRHPSKARTFDRREETKLVGADALETAGLCAGLSRARHA